MMINNITSNDMAKGSKFKKISKPAYKTNRRGPDQSQQEYIEKVSNPRTPQDLLLALQNPSSPAYIHMMNLIAAKMDTLAVINLLVERFLVEQYEATQREKDQIFKEMLAQELAVHKNIKPHEEKTNIPPTKIPLEEEKLRERLVERAQEIDTLRAKLYSIDDDIKALDKKAEKNNKEWQDIISRQRTDLLNHIQFVSSSGKVIDKDDPRHKNLATPTGQEDLNKLASVVARSYLMQAKQEESKPAEPTLAESTHKDSAMDEANQESDKNIPLAPAPPPPPPPKKPVTVKDVSDMMKSTMGGMSFVFEELRDYVNARDSDTLQDFFKAIDQNKKGGKFRGGAKERQERVAAIENAFEIVNEKVEKEEERSKKEMEVSRKEFIQAAELQVYEQKFGNFEDNTKRREQTLGSESANQAKSTGQK